MKANSTQYIASSYSPIQVLLSHLLTIGTPVAPTPGNVHIDLGFSVPLFSELEVRMGHTCGPGPYCCLLGRPHKNCYYPFRWNKWPV